MKTGKGQQEQMWQGQGGGVEKARQWHRSTGLPVGLGLLQICLHRDTLMQQTGHNTMAG